MYTTQARVEAYLDRALTDNEAILIDDIIVLISNSIEAYTNRNWSPLQDDGDEDEAGATARLYDGNGLKRLTIDDFTGIESVRLLDSEGNEILNLILTTDWLTLPANTDTKQTVMLRNYHFPVGTSNVDVTAIWGSGKVPESVVIVATSLTGKYLTQSQTSGSKFKSENIEGYSYSLRDAAELDGDIKRLLTMLDMHKKILL